MRRLVPAWLPAATAAFMSVAVSCGRASEPPTAIDSTVAVVRKTRQGYLVTPRAVIPFAATIRDGHGLSRVAYVVTATRLGVAGRFGPEGPEQKFPVGGFERLLRLREGQGTPLREYRIAAEDASSALDLGKLSHLFQEPNADEPPARFRLRVCLEATDNDVATGLHARRGETFTFIVVSELELLAEVAKEEEVLCLNLEDRAAGRLRKAQFGLRTLNERLAAATPDQVRDLSGRADEVAEAVTRAAETARDVHVGLRGIAAELKANRVRADMIDRVEKTVCAPLDEALRREFAPTAEALGELSRRLNGPDAGQARKAGAAAVAQMDALGGRLHKVVTALGDLDEVNRLIKTQLEVERLLRPRP